MFTFVLSTHNEKWIKKKRYKDLLEKLKRIKRVKELQLLARKPADVEISQPEVMRHHDPEHATYLFESFGECDMYLRRSEDLAKIYPDFAISAPT